MYSQTKSSFDLHYEKKKVNHDLIREELLHAPLAQWLERLPPEEKVAQNCSKIK